ncbi:SMI1/KNR4 family protein [Corallococcus aberystwythensis]|uniref:SMI1/KNR4 family protein n=1 Tax=Corallococcus aberystwythensis TaxID=2316722 RepID=A0A3A8PM44_9BACT|nr:SMI1/KNR4 family protein [Corallococcus aberystwythensis]RKH55741.1 SMI1/KNR4 family protein [Corallococcus aberystwythensis]
MSMKSLFAEVSRLHFPRSPATPGQLAAFEKRVGWRLDEDLRAFYLHCDGATLFAPREQAPNYRILSLDEIERARIKMRHEDTDTYGAASWYTLLYLQDGDYVLVDVAKRVEGRYVLLDAFHETYPVVEQVAASFGEFLEKALASDDAFFWLNG